MEQKIQSADPEPPGRSPDLEAFSRELAQRFPDRIVQRYRMPPRVKECREVFFVEMRSRDQVRAAAMADASMTAEERRSYKLANDAEERESIRLTIVGFGKGSPVAYEHVNTNEAIPLGEISEWSAKAWSALVSYFNAMNGLPASEIAEGIVGAETVGAFAPPSANQAGPGAGR